VGIAIADEAAALGRLVDSGSEHPKTPFRAAQSEHRLYLDTCTVPLHSHSEQVPMAYKLAVPIASQGRILRFVLVNGGENELLHFWTSVCMRDPCVWPRKECTVVT
jgi:hypothetical protein